MVLAIDNSRTVVIFVYNDIQWGELVQIGFNAGDSGLFLMLPQALTVQTLNMANLSNIGKPGIFVFRVDGKLHVCTFSCVIITPLLV